MLQLLKRHRTLLVVATLLVLPLLVYRVQTERLSAPPNPLDRLVLLISAPIERLLAGAVDLVSDRWARYVDLRGARGDNIELRRRLMALDRRITEAEALEQENTRLRTLLDLRERNTKLRLIPATIIAVGHSPLEISARIDRGLSSGVQRGNAVISEAGLIGRVQRAGYGSAEVLLLADEKVSLEVMIPRSRARGRLQGAGLWPHYRLQLLQVLRTDDVVVGDRVVTSGIGGVFPRGIPVGQVSSVEALPDGQALAVRVQPSAELSRVEEVLVLSGIEEGPEPVITPELLLPPELQTSTTATAAGTATVSAR